jgi:hypothetical protein
MARFTLSMLLVAVLSPAPATAAAALQCYTQIPSTMVGTVTSDSGYSGEVFRFKTTATVVTNGKKIPAGTLGYGVVLASIPASNRARNGIIVLEPRYLLIGGHHFQVTGNPVDASILTHGPNPVAEGMGAVPLPGFGLAANEMIHGTNITIGPGYNFHVVPIGDLSKRGPCVRG